MKITLLLFGNEARLVGERTLAIDWPESQLHASQLTHYIRKLYPQLASSTFRLAINHEFASDHQLIQSGDELALIGPVSGG